MECEAAGSSSKTIKIIATKSSTLNNVAKWSRRHQGKTYQVTLGSRTWYVKNGSHFQKRSGTSWSKFQTKLFGAFCGFNLLVSPAAAATTTGGASLLTFNAPQFLLTANSGTPTGPTSSFDGDWVRGEVLLTFTRSDDTYGMGANINGAGNIELFNENATLIISASGPANSVSYRPTWLHRNATYGSQFLAGGSATANGRDPYARAVRLKDGHLSLPGSEMRLNPEHAECGFSDRPTSGVSYARKYAGCSDPTLGNRLLVWQIDPVSASIGTLTVNPLSDDPPSALTIHDLGPTAAIVYEKEGYRAYSMMGTTSGSEERFEPCFERGQDIPPAFAQLTNSTGIIAFSCLDSFRVQMVRVDSSSVSKIGSYLTVWPFTLDNDDADYQADALGPYVLALWEKSGTWRYRLLCVQDSTITALTDATILPALAGADRATLRADPEHNRFYLQYEIGEDLYMMRIELNTGTGATTATSGLTSGTSTGVTSGITSGFTTGITSGGSGTVPTATPPASSPPPPTSTPTPPPPTPAPFSALVPEGAPPPKRPNPTVPIVLGTLGGITLLGFVVCLGKRRKERPTKDDFTDSAFATHEMTAVDRGPHYASPTGTPAVTDGGYMAAPAAEHYGTLKKRPVSDAGYVDGSKM